MGVKFGKVMFGDIAYRFKEGWYFFAPLMANGLRNSSGTLFLGLLSNNTAVGFYSIAEKALKALEVVLSPLFQSVYPFFAKMYLEERSRALVFLKKTILLSGAFSFLVAATVFIFAPLIVALLAHYPFPESIVALRILVFAVFLYGINMILGYQGLAICGYQKELFKVVLFCSLLQVALLLILIPGYGIAGAAASVVIAELAITVAEYAILKNKKII